MRTVYLNGQYLGETDAKVSVFDRGFLFGDAIYEVTLVMNGKLIDFQGHSARLQRSARELKFAFEPDLDALLEAHRELIKRNQLREGQIYLQISRGDAGDRDFNFPPSDTQPTILMFTQARSASIEQATKHGKTVVTIEDLRWKRSDIKTVQLLFASMAKMEAASRGADDAWLVKEGMVTEGTSNNAFIVAKNGSLITRPLSNEILHGITRKAVIECASDMNLILEERAFSVAEAKDALEAFSTSATAIVTSVTSVDGSVVGDGIPGPVAARLRDIYISKALETAIA